ncbi:unnamed protein product [Effrenium voratum]|nr:unnamed protein product [Effrenium voratum]
MAAVSLVDLLTGAGPAQPLLCVRDEALTLRFASGPQEFGRKWTLEREVLNASARRKPPQRPSAWVGAARRRCRLDSHKVLQRQLFPFQLGHLRRVLLDHLERIFDLGAVYHDFYAGALAEHGGPLLFRAALAKRLGEFAIGEEGDPEGYAYPQEGAPPALPKGAISPTSALELVGNFFYHAHGREQCEPNFCGGSDVPVVQLNRVAPLHMRKAFCNYYHFTTVALARIVALLPQLRADKSITVLIPHPNKKGQRSPYMRESLRLLGLEDQVMDFPPCRLVFAEELLLAGLGPRTAFGRDRLGRARAIMADVADEGPTRAVRHAVLAALRPPPARESLLLIDRHERRRMANLAEVLDALGKLPSGHTARLIYCEDLSFVEQVSAFQGAQGAVAVSGACLANSLYMPQESLVLDLVTEKNYMGADVVMPLDCGITWFWTLTLNVKVRYRSLILPEGDLDADTVEVPADMVRDILVKDLAPHPAAADGACEKLHCEPLAPVSAMCAAVDANGDSAQLCFDDLVAGRTTAALQCMQAKHRRLRAPDAAGPGDFVTSLAKLQHDAEMLAHLEVPGAALLRALHLAALRRYATRPTQAFEVRLPHNDPRREVFASVHRAVWMAPDARAEGEPMNLLDVDVERRLSSEGNAVVDGVLSDSALKIMQTHLQQSTMYYHREKSGAFLLASLDDGLASQLLAQIVEKLQEALPSMGRLCDAMAYKTLSVPTSSASFVSAQGASVAALLWLTPSKIDEVLSLPKPAGAAAVRRHAVNRMVLWRDDCAATAPIWHHHSIESDYLHRTVHLDAALSEDSFAAWDPFTDPSDALQAPRRFAWGDESGGPVGSTGGAESHARAAIRTRNGFAAGVATLSGARPGDGRLQRLSSEESQDSFENRHLPRLGHNARPNRLLHESHLKRLDAYLEEVRRSPMQWRCQVAFLPKSWRKQLLDDSATVSFPRTMSAPILGRASTSLGAFESQVQRRLHRFDLIAKRAHRADVPILAA